MSFWQIVVIVLLTDTGRPAPAPAPEQYVNTADAAAANRRDREMCKNMGGTPIGEGATFECKSGDWP